MRSSILLTILGAGLAIASPLIKKALVTEVVTDVVYEYVTETSSSSPPPYTMVVTLEVYPTQAKINSTSSSSSSTTSTSSTSSTTSTSSTSTTTTPPPPPPTTEAPAPPTTTTPPPPPPTTETPTTEAPAPPPTSAAPAAASSPAPSSAPVDYSANGLPSGSDFESVVVYHHNIHRQNHSAPDASYNNEMAGYALTVANSCVYAHDRSEGDGNYGQNIAAYGATGDSGFGSADAAAMAITDMWYDGEVNEYLPSYYGQDNPDMTNFEKWGHFSQVVWKGSTGVGCASVLCPAGTIFSGFETWFTVCNYFPVGNMGGEYGANVLPSNGAGTVTA